MKQVVQHIRTGEIRVEDVPAPALRDGCVLVRVAASVISAGTERSSLEERTQSLLHRARKNPDLVAAVLGQVRQQGFGATVRRVRGRLDSYAPLGYSAAGEVVAVGSGVKDLKPGDHVACGGAGYANHAEFIVVPKNLCARIPPGLALDAAAYATIGSIALQGIRQTAPTLGETVAVIGLGLVGQLTVQMLVANGCRVLGIDPDGAAVARAAASGAVGAWKRGEDIGRLVRSQTGGAGADAVIITAATKSDDPVQLAGEIARDRGRVVLVGDVGLRLPRAPYFLKELDVRLSRSYGPGRYDPGYEERGVDYPIGQVRWTERRNMEEFLRLAASRTIRPESLTTHRFSVAEAPRAYRLLAGRGGSRPFGVVLKYETAEQPVVATERKKAGSGLRAHAGDPLTVGFVGAGSFAQSTLLPALRAVGDVRLRTVCTGNGVSALNVARQFGFEMTTTDVGELLRDPAIGTVFIASRHNLHAPQVLAALAAGKHVFVEKPLVMRSAELDELERLLRGRTGGKSPLLMTGFNRRFAPAVTEIARFFGPVASPLAIDIRVNAGWLPATHWSRDPVEGGGRIVGEVCHFIDLVQALGRSRIARVTAEHLGASASTDDDDSVIVTMRLANGTVASIRYVANGDPSVPKERFEIFGGGRTAIMDNYRRLALFRQGGSEERSWSTVDKGHRDEVRRFMDAVQSGGPSPIEPADAVAAMRATFAVEETLRRGRPVVL